MLHPLKALKRFLPHSLLGRSLLIIVTPLILLQIVSAWIFYDRHWDTITRRLTSAVAGEIASVIDARRNFPGPENQRWLFYSAGANLGLRIAFRGDDILPNQLAEGRDGTLEEQLANALRERVRRPFHLDTLSAAREVRIQVQLPDGVLDVVVDRERLFSSTTYIFVMWMVGTSMVLFAVAMIFMRNQIRPIRRLAAAVDSFGKGRDAPDFKPEGATEIRQAANAFTRMRERIQNAITQRTEMLAGVSHDLRTPLTRMKLQLALLGDRPETEELKYDVVEMEKMVEEYLAFARGESAEKMVESDIAALLAEVVNGARYEDAVITLDASGALTVPLRPNAFKRCIVNLVGNAAAYANRIAIDATRNGEVVSIVVDDDGPGIPEDQREAVFKPFFRLDSSRNRETGGTGLGLAIARDVVRAHGGDLTIEDSPMGGVRARLRLPA
ncbi:MAG: HAMP domain-containing protein [Alphaproteobacteria bacterium]|nr:HAMP domain-containing protein [Alphaproteobacteria bacterium]